MLERLVTEAEEVLERAIVGPYARAIATREDADVGPFEAVLGGVLMRWGRIFERPALASELRAMGVEVTEANREAFRRQLGAVIAVDPLASEPWLRAPMRMWERVNVDLIKSIPRQWHEDVRVAVSEAWQGGRSTRELVERLEQRYGITRRRARLIARDQIGKLNGQLTGMRQVELGIRGYTWRTSRDERVRQRHADREGTRYTWGAPPDDGHPGMPIQCRCTAEPDVEDAFARLEAGHYASPAHAAEVQDHTGQVVRSLAEGAPTDFGGLADILALLPSIDEIVQALTTPAE